MTHPVGEDLTSLDVTAPPSRWRPQLVGVRIGVGSALHGLSAVIFGLTAVLVARQVSPAEFGELVVGMTVAFIGGDVIDFGRSKALLALQARGDTETRTTASRLLRTKLAGTPAVLLALVAASILISGAVRWHVVLFVLYAAAYATWLTLCVPIRARAELGTAASCGVQERLVALAFVAATLPVLGPSSLPLGLALGASSVCLRLARPEWIDTGKTPDAGEVWASSKRFAVVGLTTDARQLDVPLVATVAGAGVGGLFAAASRLVSPMSIVGQQASLLVFAAASTANDPLSRRGLTRLLGTLTALYAPLLLLLCWQREAFVTFLLGDAYQWSADLLPGLCLGLAISLLNDPLLGWAQARGRSELASRACTLSLLAYLVVLFAGAQSESVLLLGLAFPVLNGSSLAILLTGLFRGGSSPTEHGDRHRSGSPP